jgi:hypothetical protein
MLRCTICNVKGGHVEMYLAVKGGHVEMYLAVKGGHVEMNHCSVKGRNAEIEIRAC